MPRETATFEPHFVGRNEYERTERLGVEYNKLLDEREKLLKKLKEYKLSDYLGCNDAALVDKKSVEKVAEEWKKRARRETNFFSTADQLGIDVFREDLEDQPGLPGEHIKFGSKILRRQSVAAYVSEANTREGEAHMERPEIRLADSKPSLSGQLSFFLIRGALQERVDIMVHEIIHRKHYGKKRSTDLLLSEAQATWHGLLRSGKRDDYSVSELAAEIRTSLDLTDADSAGVLPALRAIQTLYAYGYTPKQVVPLVTASKYNEPARRWVPLQDEVDKYRQAHGLSEIDNDALRDLWRIKATNERNKARLLLFKTIEDFFPAETRAGLKEKFNRASVFACHNKRGGPLETGNVVYPQYPEFFIRQDSRQGLFFGPVPADFLPDKKPQFGIGWYNEKGGQAKLVKCAEGRALQNQLLAMLRECAAGLTLNSKKQVLQEAIYYWPVFQKRVLIAKILRSLISNAEARELFRSDYYEELRLFKEEMTRRKAQTEKSERSVIHHDAVIHFKRLSVIAEIFGIK